MARLKIHGPNKRESQRGRKRDLRKLHRLSTDMLIEADDETWNATIETLYGVIAKVIREGASRVAEPAGEYDAATLFAKGQRILRGEDPVAVWRDKA